MKYCKKCEFTFSKEVKVCPVCNIPLDNVPREELLGSDSSRENWSKEGLKKILNGDKNDGKGKKS